MLREVKHPAQVVGPQSGEAWVPARLLTPDVSGAVYPQENEQEIIAKRKELSESEG